MTQGTALVTPQDPGFSRFQADNASKIVEKIARCARQGQSY